MKAIIGMILWIALFIGLIVGCTKLIKYIYDPHPANIGPHETAYVENGDYLTLPKADITITGPDFFTLRNLESKDVIYPVFVLPSIGEESFHFVATKPPEGKYRVTHSSITLYSEIPTSIMIKDDGFDNFFKSAMVVILAFLLFILGFYYIGQLFI
jgi:hypothetical protein